MAKRRIDGKFGPRDSKRMRDYLKAQKDISWEEDKSLLGSRFTIRGDDRHVSRVTQFLRHWFK
jgi:hypothetical protein